MYQTIFIENKCKLPIKDNHLCINKDDEKFYLFLDNISTILICNLYVSFSASLLITLSEKKINMIICDNRRRPNIFLDKYFGRYNSFEYKEGK